MNNVFLVITSEISNYLLFASVISAILIIAAWGIIKLGKIQAPVYRHMIWLCTLIAVLALPVMWLYGPKVPLAILPARNSLDHALTQQVDFQPSAGPVEKSPSKIQTSGSSSITSSVKNNQNPIRPIPVKDILVCLWCAGFLFMLARLLIGWHRLACIVRSAEPVSNNNLLGNIHAGRLKLLLTSYINGPVCCGLIQPVILLPKQMYDNDIQEDLQMVLSHELAHIERRDFLVNIFQRLIEAVLFFHPLVWYASFQLTHHREQICDHHVIARGASPDNYAQLLTRIVEQGFNKNRYHAVALFEGRLLLRVRSLLEPGNNIQLKTSKWGMIAGAMVILLCMASGAIRLEAKSNINAEQESHKSQTLSNHGTESSNFKKETSEKDNRLIKGNCTISGKVVSAENGKSLDKATVMLFSRETSYSINIAVASDGSFEFKDIPGGEYGLRAGKKTGFQDACYNPEKITGQIPFFSLKDGEKKSGIIFQLKPAYSISGKVLGEDGQPLKNSHLGVLLWVESSKQDGNLSRYEIARQALVTSDGSYSLDGLDNRPVYVMVIDFGSGEKDQSWAPCYYPGAESMDHAQMVYFNKDKSVENINIQLTKKGEFVLEGVVKGDKNFNRRDL